jgi:hypothetical protein
VRVNVKQADGLKKADFLGSSGKFCYAVVTAEHTEFTIRSRNETCAYFADPYCVVYFNHQKLGKTVVIDRNLSPIW